MSPSGCPGRCCSKSYSPVRDRSNSSVGRWAGSLVTAFLLGGWLLPHLHVEWRGGPDAAAAAGAPPTSTLANAGIPAVDEPIARAAAAVSPAVVNIDTESRVLVGT